MKVTEAQQIARLKQKIIRLAEENDKLLKELVSCTQKIRAMREEWLDKMMDRAEGQAVTKPAISVAPTDKVVSAWVEYGDGRPPRPLRNVAKLPRVRFHCTSRNKPGPFDEGQTIDE